MKKKFVRQAKLPPGAITYDLAHTISYFALKENNMKKKHKYIPKVYKSAFGGYYVLAEGKYSQEELKEEYEKQEKETDTV